MRIEVAIALIPVLVEYNANQLKMLAAGVAISPLKAPFDKFADRVPETMEVCDFLAKVAGLTLPPIA